MSNLKLVPDAPTPLEKLLLDASRNEQPSEDHKARLRAALGIGLPLSGPLVAPPPAGPAPAPGAAVKAAGKSLTVAKAAVGVAALALVGVLVLARQGGEPADSSVKIAPPKARRSPSRRCRPSSRRRRLRRGRRAGRFRRPAARIFRSRFA